jgi:hypothetical protein
MYGYYANDTTSQDYAERQDMEAERANQRDWFEADFTEQELCEHFPAAAPYFHALHAPF